MLSFHYRYDSCTDALFTVSVGSHEKRLQLQGSRSEWTRASMVVSFSQKPAWVDITAGRLGSADEYTGPQHDNNVLWLDDFAVAPR